VGGFSGPDWHEAYFVNAPAPRKGIPALFGGEPITDEDLRVVPSTASYMSASKFDFGRVLDLVRQTAAAIDPETLDELEAGLARASGKPGIDLENGLLRALGPTWITYDAPAVAGPVGLGVVFVNKPRDAEALPASLTTLETF